MKNKEIDILNGSISKTILYFFFPVMLGSLFQQLYNTVDAIVVGNFVGKQALGAVGGSTGQLINLLVGFVTGLSSGATVVVAQYYGRREGKSVQESVRSGMFMAIVLGAIMMFVGIVFAPQLLSVMNVPSDIYDYSLTYMQVYFVGMIPSMIYNMGAGVLRAIGDSKRPLYFLIASCITNIVLDIIFVAFFHMEVFGAAVATVISQVVSCIMTLYVLKHAEGSYHYVLKETSCHWDILSRIIIIGLPSGIQSCLYSVSNIFIQATVNGFGTDTSAAYTAFGKIDAVFWLVSGAFGVAMMTFVGQNFGANNMERIKKGVRAGIILEALTAIGMSLVLYFFGSSFIRLFNQDAEVINIGTAILRYLSPWWVSFIFVEILSASIRACGDSMIPMVITGIGICSFRVVYLLLHESKTVFEALFCYPISWILTSLIFILYYLQGSWFKRSLKKRDMLMQHKQ